MCFNYRNFGPESLGDVPPSGAFLGRKTSCLGVSTVVLSAGLVLIVKHLIAKPSGKVCVLAAGPSTIRAVSGMFLGGEQYLLRL